MNIFLLKPNWNLPRGFREKAPTLSANLKVYLIRLNFFRNCFFDFCLIPLSSGGSEANIFRFLIYDKGMKVFCINRFFFFLKVWLINFFLFLFRIFKLFLLFSVSFWLISVIRKDGFLMRGSFKKKTSPLLWNFIAYLK